uniref:Uncharacterized protein MANES_15G164200 n=1 Tax=Rhizophora mucronata TaxID=61149 RepID=A0A2P2LAD0_RHIMU
MVYFLLMHTKPVLSSPKQLCCFHHPHRSYFQAQQMGNSLDQKGLPE